MKVLIELKHCRHLTEMSMYNHNYYELPFTVNDCNVVYAGYNLCEDFDGHVLGVLTDGQFVGKFWLHTDDKFETILFDSKEIQDHNLWT